MRRARHHTFQKPGWWLGRMTLRVVTAWSDLSIFDWESRTSPVRVLTPPVTRWGRRVVSNHALLSLRTATRRTPAGLPAPFGGPAPLAKRRRRFSRTRRRGSTTLAVSCAGCVAATWCPRRSCDCPFRGSRAFVRAVPRPSRRGSTARGFALVVSHVGSSHSVSGNLSAPEFGSETPWDGSTSTSLVARSRGCCMLCADLLNRAEHTAAAAPCSPAMSAPPGQGSPTEGH
jgi:hypothetical protein